MMGRTLEVLAGRLRKAAGPDLPASIPIRSAPAPAPESDPEPADGPVLVPLTSDDLPGDREGVPHIEVGGPRAKAPAGPQLVPPRLAAAPPAPEVVFQLLPAAVPATAPVPGADLIAYHRPDHPAARQYRLLADGIAAQHPAGRPPVLLFAPASARTAGTATVANLAVTRAADGFGRVLVVEAERGPGSAAERFGIPPVPGLRELLARTVPLGLGLHRTAVEGVYLIPSGKCEVGTDEAARLPALLDQLRGRFEWILVDAPVWGTFPLADWARASDAVYLVLRPDEWDSPHADQAHDGIRRAGGKLRGCVTTQEAPPASPVVPVSFPEARVQPPGSADGHGGGDEVVDHVVPPVEVPRRRLRVPHVVRRPGDD
jgi:Mrp family chromosome partitioning ATPase